MRVATRASAAALISLVCAPFASADRLVLRSGKTLRVEALDCDASTCRAQIHGGEVLLAPSEVLRIEADEIVDPEPSPPAAEGAPVPRSIEQIVADAARRFALPVSLVRAVARAESSFRPDAVSPKGARGVMQLMPGTAADLGVRDAFDPEENILAGARLLRSLLEKYDGRVAEALAAYNAGAGAVAKHGGVPPYRETRGYIRKVVRDYERNEPDDTGGRKRPVARPSPSPSPAPSPSPSPSPAPRSRSTTTRPRP